MIDNVWLVKPTSYPHSLGLEHIARSFSDALNIPLVIGDQCNGNPLVFCGHTLAHGSRNITIYNSEQISDKWLEEHPVYLQVLRESGAVWDYSRNNIEALSKHGIDARLVEIGYMPGMTRVKDRVKDTDLMFYGSTASDRRQELFRKDMPGNNNKIVFGIYGDEIYDLIDRSRIILNVHFYDTGIHEIFRTSQLMANGSCVVTEYGKDKLLEERFYGAMSFVEYEDIPKRCVELLDSPFTRQHIGEEAFRIFSSRTQIDILKEVGAL